MSILSIEISEERPDSPDAMPLIAELDADLLRHDYPAESRHAFSVEKLIRENVIFFVVRYDGEPAACAGLKLFGAEYAEVKRMFVRPAFRGRGLGKAVLRYMTEYARARDIPLLRLETGIYQVEAIGLYERFGFQRRRPFGEYREDPMSVYFEKAIE